MEGRAIGIGDEQGPPQTPEEWFDAFRALVSRVPGVFRTVYRRGVSMASAPAGATFAKGPRLVIPITDDPATTNFALRIQCLNATPAAVSVRYGVNVTLTGAQQIITDTAANGHELIANSVENMPVTRQRRIPVTVDLVAIGPVLPANVAVVVVTVFEMRRWGHFPT